jgi:hypothetical protein
MKFPPPGPPPASSVVKRLKIWTLAGLIVPGVTLAALKYGFEWRSGWLVQAAGGAALLLVLMLAVDGFWKDGHIPPPDDPY